MKGAVAFFMVWTCITDCAGVVASALVRVAGSACDESWKPLASRTRQNNRAVQAVRAVRALTSEELLRVCQEIERLSQSHEEQSAYVGQRVQILLDYDDPAARLVGTLRSVTLDGEALLILDDDTPRYCWPCLRVEATT